MTRFPLKAPNHSLLTKQSLVIPHFVSSQYSPVTTITHPHTHTSKSTFPITLTMALHAFTTAASVQSQWLSSFILLHLKCTVKYAASSFTTWLGRHSSLVVQSCASYAENARTCTLWVHYDTKQCTPYKTSVLWKSVKTSALEHSSLVGEKAALDLCPASGLNWYFHQRQYIYNI